MAKINITFNGVKYSIDESKLIDAQAKFASALSIISDPIPSEGLAYTLNTDKASYSVKIGTCTDTDVVIASEYEGLPVTSIGPSAFNNYYKLTSITIPDSVTSIGHSAFNYCKRLTSITIPDGVTSIESSTFKRCESLTSITIPDSVTSVGAEVFEDCTNLEGVIIGSGIQTIGFEAFNNCTKLTNITFKGTIAQWETVTKYTDWHKNVPATYVQCSDGTVTL